MLGMLGNYWIWILLAFFLLSSNDGCGFDFKGSNIFGCGNNTWWIIAIVAIFLLKDGGLTC